MVGMVYFSWILIAGVPVALAALAVWLDKKTRRGYGLAFLSTVLLALDIWMSISIAQAIQRADAQHTYDLAFGLVLAVFFLIGLYLTLVLVIGGIVEAGLARHWRWLALIAVVSAMLAFLVLGPSTARMPDLLGALGLSRDVEFLALLLIPGLVTLAYAVIRTLRPVSSKAPPASQRDLSEQQA